ncbi:uncharacterized protein LOC111705714 [Eurytemora carolleeae]|uniref:uncharacterized protein LOC111705714 n=1 Tax=Eurytemora carolleeae TaxID=1294199 RepID=UPI000C76FD5C|nr:uncharacterized protein LOC111705714 [Eurytemora carolleeae]|eukprot:XP_023334127.1 uncharacterized protein LOC111705714 [Eurytemora affinis]
MAPPEGIYPSTISGSESMKNPRINKGLAAGIEERQILGIHGLLPPRYSPEFRIHGLLPPRYSPEFRIHGLLPPRYSPEFRMHGLLPPRYSPEFRDSFERFNPN